eukprot:COSAG01_NODE_2455_length_7669_cov_11.422457_7_plen_53_part_00
MIALLISKRLCSGNYCQCDDKKMGGLQGAAGTNWLLLKGGMQTGYRKIVIAN